MTDKKLDKKKVSAAMWTTAGAVKDPYATVDDDKATRVRKFALRNWGVLAALLLLVICWFTLGSVDSGRESTLDGQRGQIVSLKQELSLVKDRTRGDRDKAVAEATGGMDAEVKAADDKKVSEMMTKALTWDGLREYLSRRDQVKSEYGFAEDSPFMAAFMPGEAQGVARTAPSGKTYSEFDPTISSNFVSLTSYVTGTDTGSYSYAAVVVMRSKASTGSATATGEVFMTYDMIEGKPTNVDAYIVPDGVKTSG